MGAAQTKTRNPRSGSGGRGAGAGWQAVIVASVAAVFGGANTGWTEPPRYDGAGYAVLSQALLSGQGYREIDHPLQPPHTNFPPVYPLALAAVWSVTGRSIAAAHGLSWLATVAATVAAWVWLRRLFSPRVALILALALAVNWTWGRLSGAIQSEPLFLLGTHLALLAAVWTSRSRGLGPPLVLGATLAAVTLTRQVGLCLAVAIGLDLLLRRQWRAAAATGLTAAVLMIPWVVWQASQQGTPQVSYLFRTEAWTGIGERALFYVQRIPDQVTGPVVEVGTVFRESPGLRIVTTVWAVLASAVVVVGWTRSLRSPRRRLAALVSLTTLALLLIWPFTEAGRFLGPLVPFLLVGAVEGLVGLGLWMGGRPRRCRTWAALAVLAVSLPYAVYGLATHRAEAQRRTHQAFDAACSWLARHGDRPGLVLTRHPGEVFVQTGRQGLAPAPDDEPETIAQTIDRFGVAYLLVDEQRYARAPTSPLTRFAARHPDRVAPVWLADDGSITLYEVVATDR